MATDYLGIAAVVGAVSMPVTTIVGFWMQTKKIATAATKAAEASEKAEEASVKAAETSVKIDEVVEVTANTNEKVEIATERVQAVAVVVNAVDRAVNGKGPGKSTISEDVSDIKAKQERDAPSGGEDALLPMMRQMNQQMQAMQAWMDDQEKSNPRQPPSTQMRERG